MKTIDELARHETGLYLADNAMSPRQLSDRCIVAGLRLAAKKCVEVFTKSNATYRQTRDQHDDGRSSGAEECEQAILALIPKEPSNVDR